MRLIGMSAFRRTAMAAAVFTLFHSVANGQQIKNPPPSVGAPKAVPYLTAGSIEYRQLLAPPPAVGSERDRADQATVLLLQKAVGDERFQSATIDANYVYARFAFADALGHSIDPSTMPLTVHLLNRALRDVADPILQAKNFFQRPRPFQRFRLSRVCGMTVAPAPEADPIGGSSYPSGHSAYGWATALILAQIAPDHAPELLEKASEYAESRLICGVHFPSDIEAGRVLAVAMVERLKNVPAFEADLASARVEFASVHAGGRQH
jgi:acid phosphatase (class A)